LVGTEKLGLPFFVNSPHFEPTEPRDGIYLTNKDGDDIELNKKVMKEAVEYYRLLIDYAIEQEWENLHRFAQITIPPLHYWLSVDWLKEYVIYPVRDKIYAAPLVKLENGLRASLRKNNNQDMNILIPFNGRREVREAIWELAYQVFPSEIPAKQDIHSWYEIFNNDIWDKVHRLDISTLAQYITRSGKTLGELNQNLGINEPIIWINHFFDILQIAEENPLDFLEKGNHLILPN
jgi:hypothetical protein